MNGEKGKVYYNRSFSRNGSPKFLTKDEALQCLKKNHKDYYDQIMDNDLSDEEIDEILCECRIDSYDKFYYDDDYLETFYKEFITLAGEDVVAFGYYGYDG